MVDRREHFVIVVNVNASMDGREKGATAQCQNYLA